LIHAQEQVASGKRILRPSDDAVGTSLSLALRRQIGSISSYIDAIGGSRPIIETATAQLQTGLGILTEARGLALNSLSGSLNASDREAIAMQLESLRDSLLDVANASWGDRFLFAGTATGSRPWNLNGDGTAEYQGDHEVQFITIGRDEQVGVNMAGSSIFGEEEFTGVTYAGMTGVALGQRADYGTGFDTLLVTHTGTTGALGAGLAFANGGQNTILGAHTIVVDGAAGTIQMGSGPLLEIPDTTDSDFTNFALEDADGSVLYVDFTAYNGGSWSGTISGNGEISLDGINFQTIDFVNTDLEVIDSVTGSVLHVDTTGITRAADELVTFSGTPNVFDVLGGMIQDLRSGDALDTDSLMDRLRVRLDELDRGFNNVLAATGLLGSRSERLNHAATRLEGMGLHLQGLQSNVEDVDLSTAILEMGRTQLTLQAAQAAGARLIQQSLLNYLR
jgi:flagellar hook-associated protein 3 FlgL